MTQKKKAVNAHKVRRVLCDKRSTLVDVYRTFISNDLKPHVTTCFGAIIDDFLYVWEKEDYDSFIDPKFKKDSTFRYDISNLSSTYDKLAYRPNRLLTEYKDALIGILF